METAKKIAVLGAGESGVGAALLAKKKGMTVFVSDSGTIAEKYRKVLSSNGIHFEEGKHSEEEILSADEVVKSPGIPDKAALIVKLRKKGVSVISEIELAGRYSNATMIGITGSNGKTTTTMLMYHTMQKAGLDVGLAGNVGESLAKQVADQDRDYFVIELSSFQLDGMIEFRVNIAILLNITPDHLDRYDYEMQNYIDSKLRILQNQEEGDCLIYNDDDENIKKELEERKIESTQYPISLSHEVEQGGFLKNEQITVKLKDKTLQMSIYELTLQGKHNAFNSMAAAIASRVLDIRKEIIRESLSDFQNVEHRLEKVTKVHNIEFVNDSKATNVNSTWYALETVERPIVWIVGGVDKGNDYASLEELVRLKVKAIVCLGKDNEKIRAAFEGVVADFVEASTIDEAVRQSYRLGFKGDTVLLSPACASFDLFENYEDRGAQFKRAVKAL